MVPILLVLEISAPAIELIEALPEGAQLCVVFSPGEVDPVSVQVQIRGEPDKVQAINDTLARLGIKNSDPLVSTYFPESDLVAEIKGAIH